MEGQRTFKFFRSLSNDDDEKDWRRFLLSPH